VPKWSRRECTSDIPLRKTPDHGDCTVIIKAFEISYRIDYKDKKDRRLSVHRTLTSPFALHIVKVGMTGLYQTLARDCVCTPELFCSFNSLFLKQAHRCQEKIKCHNPRPCRHKSAAALQLLGMSRDSFCIDFSWSGKDKNIVGIYIIISPRCADH